MCHVCLDVHLQRQDSMKIERVFAQTGTLKKRIARLVNENEVRSSLQLVPRRLVVTIGWSVRGLMMPNYCEFLC